jgi:hypothetical protein
VVGTITGLEIAVGRAIVDGTHEVWTDGMYVGFDGEYQVGVETLDWETTAEQYGLADAKAINKKAKMAILDI